MADPEIDQFAQTRGADDLFDDEIIPVSAEEQVPSVDPTPAPVTEENIAALERDAPPPAPRADTPRSRGGERRGRGRGRGRGRQASRKRGGDGGSQAKSTEDSSVPEQEKNGDQESKPDAPAEPAGEDPNKEDATSVDTKETDGPRVPAVRGDRSATGGLRKPKLTEEELSKKIAAAKEHAAKVAAAHARAEADQASFLEREKVADAKRRQERAHRRAMDSERERNRQRKLNAVTGREWDSQKQEEDYNGSRGKGNFRGMHGGVTGQVRRGLEDSRWATAPEETPSDEPSESHSHHHPHHSPRGRGRGGRRGGRGRGGHRGHDEATPPQSQQRKPAAPALDNQAEFPALPGEPKKPSSTSTGLSPEDKTTSTTKSDPLSPLSPMEGSWADQVESQ